MLNILEEAIKECCLHRERVFSHIPTNIYQILNTTIWLKKFDIKDGKFSHAKKCIDSPTCTGEECI